MDASTTRSAVQHHESHPVIGVFSLLASFGLGGIAQTLADHGATLQSGAAILASFASACYGAAYLARTLNEIVRGWRTPPPSPAPPAPPK